MFWLPCDQKRFLDNILRIQSDHSPCADGRPVGCDEDGLRELDEGVEDLSVVLHDEAVQDLRVHRLQGAAQVHA